MKKYYIVFWLTIFFSQTNIVYAHKEWVHQYMVWESYSFLKINVKMFDSK